MAEFLCVGIPARNEQESIERTIRSITSSVAWRQTHSQDKELIVCVNGSSDRTAQIVQSLSATIPEIRLVVLREAGKNLAINTIAKAASEKAKEIYFSDADVLVGRQTIGKVLQELRANKKVEFASAVVIPAAAYFPKKQRGPRAEFYAQRSRIARKQKLFHLCGACYAAKKKFILGNPLPEDPAIEDDRFINAAFREKIKIVYDAFVVARQSSWFDHIRHRTRHKLGKKAMLKEFPSLQKERRKKTVRVGFTARLSPKAQVGFALERLAELAASISARRKAKEPWPQTKSTKLAPKRRR